MMWLKSCIGRYLVPCTLALTLIGSALAQTYGIRVTYNTNLRASYNLEAPYWRARGPAATCRS